MRTSLVAIALSLVLVAGCGNAAPPVDWGDKYSPTVKTRLDRLIQKKDCSSLRAELATAKSIDEAKKQTSGSGSADLVAYIKWGLDKADCDHRE